MSYINQRRHGLYFPKIKRLQHTHPHGEKPVLNHIPSNIIDQTSNYIKYFDYPLSELLTDHSTDPLQNTTRQYVNTSLNDSNEGRFKNHEMIIRRKGETTILRPKQDLVLVNGFAPAIRPSSLLPTYQSVVSHSQVGSSLSIMNKMSIKKREQTTIIKSKRPNKYRRKFSKEKFIENHQFHDYNFSNNFSPHNLHDPTFIHLVKQTLEEIVEERNFQPVPLMSIIPEFPNQNSNFNNQPFAHRLEEIPINQSINYSSYPNQQQFIPSLFSIPTSICNESSYNSPLENNRSSYINFMPQEHVCSDSSNHRNYAHMSGFFF